MHVFIPRFKYMSFTYMLTLSTSSTGLLRSGREMSPVVRRVDSAIHWITQLALIVFIRWIAIYPVDSVIHLLNNRGLHQYCRGQGSNPAQV